MAFAPLIEQTNGPMKGNDVKNEHVIIQGRSAVLVSSTTGFDLANPERTKAHEFAFVNEKLVNDGVLDKNWAAAGYRFVGYADITVQINPVKEMLVGAVAALRAEQTSVLANAQKDATRLEGEIQKLLAIGHDLATA